MPTKIDLIGRVYGSLTVKSEAERRGRSKIHWLCQCSCGKTAEVAGSNLQSGASKTCGCSQEPESLVGNVYGEWTVQSIGARLPSREVTWNCLCSCGTFKVIAGSSLTLARSLSCGCLSEHGYRHTATYAVWSSLKQRIANPNCKDYSNYGGRGLTMPEDWLDFRNFLRDMGERPEGMSIERIDNSLGYSKENCIWATAVEQARNKRNNVTVLYRGSKIILKDAAKLAGVRYGTVYQRLFRQNYSVAEALESSDFSENIS